MSQVTHLYNSAGVWIAFRSGDVIYDAGGEWIGWLPWHDDEVVDKEGRYLGTIIEGNRLFRSAYHEDRENPGYPGYPEPAADTGYPGFGGSVPLPPDMTDVTL